MWSYAVALPMHMPKEGKEIRQKFQCSFSMKKLNLSRKTAN